MYSPDCDCDGPIVFGRVDMETERVALDLRTRNSKSADARDGIFVVVCSPTTFDNKL